MRFILPLLAAIIVSAHPSSAAVAPQPTVPSAPPSPAAPVHPQMDTYLYPAGTESGVDPVHFIAPDGRKLAVLSFDDGPDPLHTAQILDALHGSGDTATFFLVGSRTRSLNPSTQATLRAVVQRILTEGCEIGSHSYTHPQMTHLDRAAVRNELVETDAALREAAPGVRIAWFRPPYGDSDDMVVQEAARLSMRTIRWDIDPQDWKSSHSANEIRDEVISHLHPGAVVLMHSTLENTAAAFPEILAQAHRLGYRFVSVQQWWSIITANTKEKPTIVPPLDVSASAQTKKATAEKLPIAPSDPVPVAFPVRRIAHGHA